MDTLDKRDKKLINIGSHSAAMRVNNRENQSVSTSRGKKYFKISDKAKTSRNQMISFFMKKSRNQIVPNSDDYGLDAQIKQRVIETSKNNYMRSSKILNKNEQAPQKSQINMLKNSAGKRYKKYSETAKSLESLIRVQTCGTPKKKSFLKKVDKSAQPPSPQITMDTRNYEKTIKFLQRENQYYEGLYINSQQRIEDLKRQAEDERKKYERVRRIYQQKITQISINKEACQKNLGHIYTFENPPIDIVPDDVIVQNSLECSVDELQRTSRKNSDLASSKLSTLSVNSR